MKGTTPTWDQTDSHAASRGRGRGSHRQEHQWRTQLQAEGQGSNEGGALLYFWCNVTREKASAGF